MKRALIWILALTFLIPAAQAADNGWPDDLSAVQRMVRSTVGDVPFDRVKVHRDGKVLDISIKLNHVSRQARAFAEEKAGDDDIFLATNLVAFFEPDLDVSQDYALTPIADFFDYYFGFGVFNFGKKIKRPATIAVTGFDGLEFENFKKKWKINKNSVQLRFLETGVSAPGLYELYTKVGPWELTTYFCSSCT